MRSVNLFNKFNKMFNFLLIKETLDAELFSTLIIIRNISRAAKQYFQKISEGSCDTEDCDENKFLHHMNKLHFKIYSNRKVILNCNNIS